MRRSSNMPPCFSIIFVSIHINTWVVERNSKVMKKRLANLDSGPTYVHAVVHMGPGCWFAANQRTSLDSHTTNVFFFFKVEIATKLDALKSPTCIRTCVCKKSNFCCFNITIYDCFVGFTKKHSRFVLSFFP